MKLLHKTLLVGVFSLATALVGFDTVSAHVPVLVHPQHVDDYIVVEDTQLSQAFYGELQNFPHTYSFRIDTPTSFYAEILVPDIVDTKNIISAILIKEESAGYVSAVARLRAEDAEWISRFEFFGGDSYRHGPSFEDPLEAGEYRLEVHSNENIEKYVLVIGTEEAMPIGYFELIRRIAHVKEFFGKSQFMIIQSPFVYMPIVLILTILAVYLLYIRRRQKRTHISSV